MPTHFCQGFDKILKRLLVCCLLTFTAMGANALGSDRYASTSILSTGHWVKIKISDSGIYQISATDLKKWGFSNLSKVKIYGYGGAGLPEDFSKPYIDDLPQIPILKTADNRILFYAQGILTWYLNGSLSGFEHERNPYSTAGYYFITENDANDISIPTEKQGTLAQTDITRFNDYALHEQELTNIGKSGRVFYGEDFRYTTLQKFVFDIPGITEDSVNMQVDFVAKVSVTPSQVKLSHNRSQLPQKPGDFIQVSNDYYQNANLASIKKNWKPSTYTADTITVSHTGSGHKVARLDFIRLNMKRELKLYNGSVRFRSVAAVNQSVRYNIAANNERPRIWDITNPQTPFEITPDIQGNTCSFIAPELGLREYIAFNPDKTFPTPENVGNIGNQNLHGLPQTDMVIIVPAEFRDYAEQLAELHRKNDQLTVTLADPNDIYNEFSSGAPDATAYRRFMKMFYDRAMANNNVNEKPKYLLLFGDGIYDNRLISPELKSYKYPFLMTYESKNGLNDTESYTTDDYFGFLDDNEGKNLASDNLDIGIGRFTVRTALEAETVVNKIINYIENKDYGIWKNNLCFVADDGKIGANDRDTFMRELEKINALIEKNNNDFFSTKIYLDAYKKISSASGGSYPDAKKKFFDLLDQGVLMVDYSGHGSTVGWTAEDFLNINDIKKLYLKRLPLWVTATCDFSRFDDPTTSGGEELFLNPKGGGIALFSTTRPVYTNSNGDINNYFIQHIFGKDGNGVRLRLGDVMREAKKEMKGDGNKLRFLLIGDPAMKLAYAEYKIHITDINENPVDSNNPDTLKARSTTTMKGVILDPSGEKATSFNGLIFPRVYDSKEKITTLDNDKIGHGFTYDDRTKLLYSGKDSVRNGEFTFTFKMPKEINYSYKSGLVNLYANDASGIEAQGVCEDFIVGDYEDEIEEESEGPTIYAAYLNTSSFKDGDIVNETPGFYAEMEDPSGINVSGNGIGHDMTITIDHSTTQQYVLNHYFAPTIGQFGKGSVFYKIPELSEGNHTLTFKVWDNENNSSEKTFSFSVKKGLKPKVFDLYVSENPARESVKFYLRHDRPNEVIQLKIFVYNLIGSEVWSHQEEGQADMYTSFPIEWNLTSKTGSRIPSGVYLYKAVISTDGINETTKAKKIIVLKE